MINFSTEFPIDSKNTVEDVLGVAWDWVRRSPHTRMPTTSFSQLPVDDEETHVVGDQQVTIAFARLPGGGIGGLRYVHHDLGLEWTTSIVAWKTPEQHLLGIQVACEALSTAVRLPSPKKPYIVKLALERLGGGMDGQVPVADRPFRLSNGEAGIAAALMLGTAHNRLPIIYVSAGFDGRHRVSPDELAKWVSGLAHVVVEPNRQFSLTLRTLAAARNVYGGAVGVYWPESTARKSYFSDTEILNPRELQLEVAKDIRLALCNRRATSNCTWPHLTETIARKRYDLLKSQNSTELQAYIDAFDADQAAKDAKLVEAEREIARLNAEIKRQTSTVQGASRGLLIGGDEHDLYEGETNDTLIAVLQDALRMSKQHSRREHVLSALIRSNRPLGERQRLSEAIKALLKTYRGMDARTRGALARLGFDVSDDGKHHKVVFQGDGRYTFSFPKSSSDHRAGRNLASDIASTLF